MNFNKEATSDNKKIWGKVGGGEREGTETKAVCQTVSNEVNTTRGPKGPEPLT